MSIESNLTRLIEHAEEAQALVQREVPMLSPEWGARDEDALVHTLGINLLAAWGRLSGAVGVVEWPVPRAQEWQRKLVRVDAVWFDRGSRRPVLLAEFERFSVPTAKEKLTNLYVAAHGCDAVPGFLLLCLWALDGSSIDTSWYQPGIPLSVPGGRSATPPVGTQVWIVHAVLGRTRDLLHLLRFRRLV